MLLCAYTVPSDLSFDASGPLSVVESCDSFLETKRVRTDTSYHNHLSVSSKWIFKKSGKFAISIRHMSSSLFSTAFNKSIDAVS